MLEVLVLVVLLGVAAVSASEGSPQQQPEKAYVPVPVRNRRR